MAISEEEAKKPGIETADGQTGYYEKRMPERGQSRFTYM
jgi:hypothetical protein